MNLLYVVQDPGIRPGSQKGAWVHVQELQRALAGQAHVCAACIPPANPKPRRPSPEKRLWEPTSCTNATAWVRTRRPSGPGSGVCPTYSKSTRPSSKKRDATGPSRSGRRTQNATANSSNAPAWCSA
ncbi:MAG: hypothetical protein R3E96_02995 [Planctomycetota bacterium]